MENSSYAGDILLGCLPWLKDEDVLALEEVVLELEREEAFIEFLKSERQTNPDNHELWVNYVEENTSSRIEALKLP